MRDFPLFAYVNCRQYLFPQLAGFASNVLEMLP